MDNECLNANQTAAPVRAAGDFQFAKRLLIELHEYTMCGFEKTMFNRLFRTGHDWATLPTAPGIPTHNNPQATFR